MTTREQTWEVENGLRFNVTSTEPGDCAFFDWIGCHAYMGGLSLGKSEWAHRENWTTCCDVDETVCPDCTIIDDRWVGCEVHK